MDVQVTEDRSAADATGFDVARAGTVLPAGFCQRIGLSDLLSAALAPTRERASVHAPGRVLAGLAVMIAASAIWWC